MLTLALFFDELIESQPMRSLFFSLIVAGSLFLGGCVGANYYLKRGNYDAAIRFAVEKLRKNPNKADKHILALETAFNIEKVQILDRIEFLKLDGSPDSWVEIHALYAEIDAYQRAIKPVLPLYLKKEHRYADIELIDVNEALVDAKQKAAAFLYAKGVELLSQNTKFSAREAFTYFQKVKEYYGMYQDVDRKMDEAFQLGQNHILVRYGNTSPMIIPQEFFANLMQYDEQSLNGLWTSYYLDAAARSDYDYFIDVAIFQVNIGPEQVNNTSHLDQKQVEDGFQYVLDANGNVAKDSLGNDIKEPKFKTIKATVYKSEQTKVGQLGGEVKYSKANGQVFQRFLFQENLVFKNFFASFQGDPKALSKESKAIIGGQAIPFPSDVQMVMDASQLIKTKTLNLIQSNQALVLD